MTGPDPATLAILFCVSIVAGCFDAIAGGGGLITVPALILAGLDPAAAIATNKVQGFAGTVSATIAFARRGLIAWRDGALAAMAAACAGIAGALSVSLMSRPVLSAVVPVLLLAIAGYFAVSRKLGDADAHARIPPWLFTVAIVPVIGFYDGVFGPGAGSFYMIGFVSLLGFGVLRATGYTKLTNASSNFGSLAAFAVSGAIVWPVGLVMAAGAFLGAQIGSLLAIRLGSRLIKPLIIIIACIMAAKLLSDPANPLSQGIWRLVTPGRG